jgi:M6 family metalloprotease-like protein
LAFNVATSLVVKTSAAYEPPRPGEIEQLRATGQFASRLLLAGSLRNHEVNFYILRKAINKVRRMILKLSGRTPSEIEDLVPVMAPPADWRGMPTTGDVRILTILIEFQDHAAVNTRNDIDDGLFGAGDPALSPYESLAAYYARASYNQLDLSNGNTLDWYQTAYDRTTIDQSTTGRESLIKEVLDYHENQGHDFSQYDADGDGAVDYLVVIYAGPPDGWGTFWWGYYTKFLDTAYTLDGKTLGNYSWQWETVPAFNPRIVIHETGHALGVPDYYDYDDTVGPVGGLGGLDMMDANRGDHNCFSKFMLDWLVPYLVSGGTHFITLQASGDSPSSCVAIWPGITNDDLFSEFFLVQNRHRVENDAGLPGDGMLIWHIDATLNAAGTNFEYNNSFTAHKLVRLMEADGLEEIEAGLPADADDYWDLAEVFAQETTPSSARYDGTDSHVQVFNFGLPAVQMSATLQISWEALLPAGTVVAYSGDAVPDGWLLCDGSTVSRNQYSALFAAIGEVHGQGDGTTTFNLPDYRGYFLRGVDGGAGRDPDVATRTPLGPPWSPQQVGTVQPPATAPPVTPFVTNGGGQHSHSYMYTKNHHKDGTRVERFDEGKSDSLFELYPTGGTQSAGQHSHAISGGDTETRPKNAYVHWIIKY